MIAEERKLFFFCSFHLSGWPQPMQAYAIARGSQQQPDLHTLPPTHSVTASGTNDNLVLPFTLMQGAGM